MRGHCLVHGHSVYHAIICTLTRTLFGSQDFLVAFAAAA